MGDENDGGAVRVEPVQDFQYVLAGPGIQGAGRFVGCWPPDISVGLWRERSARPTFSSASSVRSERREGDIP